MGWLVALVLLLLAGVGAWAFLGPRLNSTPVVEVQRVTAISAASAPNGVVLNATGYIVAAHKIELAAKVVGKVSWIGVDKGDRVKEGQVLVRLEDDEYQAYVQQAKGQLASLQAKLDEAVHGSRVWREFRATPPLSPRAGGRGGRLSTVSPTASGWSLSALFYRPAEVVILPPRGALWTARLQWPAWPNVRHAFLRGYAQFPRERIPRLACREFRVWRLVGGSCCRACRFSSNHYRLHPSVSQCPIIRRFSGVTSATTWGSMGRPHQAPARWDLAWDLVLPRLDRDPVPAALVRVRVALDSSGADLLSEFPQSCSSG
jgi:hypothetical protein